jgi:hypothetical protein
MYQSLSRRAKKINDNLAEVDAKLNLYLVKDPAERDDDESILMKNSISDTRDKIIDITTIIHANEMGLNKVCRYVPESMLLTSLLGCKIKESFCSKYSSEEIYQHLQAEMLRRINERSISCADFHIGTGICPKIITMISNGEESHKSIISGIERCVKFFEKIQSIEDYDLDPLIKTIEEFTNICLRYISSCKKRKLRIGYRLPNNIYTIDALRNIVQSDESKSLPENNSSETEFDLNSNAEEK